MRPSILVVGNDVMIRGALVRALDERGDEAETPKVMHRRSLQRKLAKYPPPR